MSIYRDQNAGNLRKWMDKVDRFMKQSKLANSAVGRDGIEVYDGGWIRILNGGLEVIGTATISGTLDVTGTTNLSGQTAVSGPMEISGTTNITGNTNVIGELNVTGPTTLDGITDIGGDTTITGLLDVQGDTTISGQLDVTGAMATKGTLSVEGVTTLSADLNIEAGGKINAGNLQIEPANGGQINFSNGSLADGQFGLAISNTVGVQIATQSLKASLPSKSSVTANVYIDESNQLWRVV